MAKIYGIELKAVKRFAGHEGEACYQGNVYKDGKKIGFWSQDSHMGCDEYEFDIALLDDVLNKMKTSSYFKKRFMEPRAKKTRIPIKELYELLDADVLMYTLVTLREDEKLYKKYKKQGYPITMIITDGYHMNAVAFKESVSEDQLAKKVEEIKASAVFFKNAHIETKVYRSLDDFEIIK